MAIWPDFPQENFILLGTWVGSRITEKTIAGADPTVRAWKTGEFWVAIAGSMVQYIFPGMDMSMINWLAIYVGGRPIQKGVVAKMGANKEAVENKKAAPRKAVR